MMHGRAVLLFIIGVWTGGECMSHADTDLNPTATPQTEREKWLIRNGITTVEDYYNFIFLAREGDAPALAAAFGDSVGEWASKLCEGLSEDEEGSEDEGSSGDEEDPEVWSDDDKAYLGESSDDDDEESSDDDRFEEGEGGEDEGEVEGGVGAAGGGDGNGMEEEEEGGGPAGVGGDGEAMQMDGGNNGDKLTEGSPTKRRRTTEGGE